MLGGIHYLFSRTAVLCIVCYVTGIIEGDEDPVFTGIDSSTTIFEDLTMYYTMIFFNLQGIEYKKELIEQDLLMVANGKNDSIKK